MSSAAAAATCRTSLRTVASKVVDLQAHNTSALITLRVDTNLRLVEKTQPERGGGEGESAMQVILGFQSLNHCLWSCCEREDRGANADLKRHY